MKAIAFLTNAHELISACVGQGVNSLVSREDVEERRLAGTGRSHDSRQLAGPQPAAHGFQNGLHIWNRHLSL